MINDNVSSPIVNLKIKMDEKFEIIEEELFELKDTKMAQVEDQLSMLKDNMDSS